MTKTPSIPSRLKRHAKLIGSCALLVVWVSCARFPVREGWNENRGPVIPHDSFPADCTLCHTGTDWVTMRDDFTYDHEAETGLRLDGAHAQAQCLLCHNDRGPVQAFAAKGCAGCHVDVHLGRLGNACQSCHDENTWRPTQAIAEHNRTRFPLIGAHAAVDCVLCHEGAGSGVFLAMDVSCVSCHLDDYNRTSAPNHAASGFGTACQDCHVAVNWSGSASMSHPSTLPLTGGHGGLSCSVCHTTPGTFTGLSPDCVTCHLSDSLSASPSHTGFSTNCRNCHTTNAWQPANFSHTSSFPLSNGHGGLSCSDCHTGGVYTGLSTACVSCHLADSTAATPDHTGFSTSCQNCHTTSTWLGASFNHTATFPLTNSHGGLSCTACHSGGVYTGLSTACVSCHLSDYNATTDPNHTSAGFPTTCQSCHNTSGWVGANFNHEFPIQSGRHAFSCVTCHTTPGSYATFSCIDCHEHSQSNAGSHHDDVGGYVWSSPACYSCHPKGRQD